MHVYAAARTMDKAKEAVEKLAGNTSKNIVEAIVIDLTDDESIARAAAKIDSLDILVNNAGIYVKEDLTTPQKTRQSLQDTFNTNLFGTISLTHALLPSLLKTKDENRAAVINITSGLASLTNMIDPSSPQYKTNEITYSSSKTALNVYTISLSKQYPHMRIVAVAPGHTATALNGFHAPQTVDVGARYIVDAILDFDGPTGVYLQRDKRHDW